ncbi:MAG: class II aldolase/adducin family protein [Betaproteobacteria bacterium]|nr:class II aldolase/adducin family protein [Betaproteobacteria bacterium]
MADTRTLAAEVLHTARAMNASGINRGTAGNVSARREERGGFLITPSGMAYEESSAEDIVTVGMDGHWQGARKPSSEWRFHRDIYAAKSRVGAVVHTHSAFATALACMGCDIPPFHYMIARFGGKDVRCASYATFGTQELSDAALLALQDRSACLLAHHGMIVCGSDLKQALALAVELETLCEQYWRVLQIGAPKLLPDEEMERVLEKFSGYGQQ